MQCKGVKLQLMQARFWSIEALGLTKPITEILWDHGFMLVSRVKAFEREMGLEETRWERGEVNPRARCDCCVDGYQSSDSDSL